MQRILKSTVAANMLTNIYLLALIRSNFVLFVENRKHFLFVLLLGSILPCGWETCRCKIKISKNTMVDHGPSLDTLHFNKICQRLWPVGWTKNKMARQRDKLRQSRDNNRRVYYKFFGCVVYIRNKLNISLHHKWCSV